MPVDKFGRMSDAKTKDTGVSLTYINNNYIRRDGGTPVSGSIDMRGETQYNVSDPVNPQDAATKKYVDKVGGGDTAIYKTQYGTFGSRGNIDMRGYTLMNVLDPADAQDVATKKYVDAANRAFIFDNNKYLAVGEVSMGGKRLENVGTPLENFQATNKFYVDTLVSSVYLGILGQPFYPNFPHFSSFFLKLKNQDHFSKSLKNLKHHRYIIQLLHHHHMIYL